MTSTTPHIVVLGGGFGGLEAAFLLRMRLQDKANITLISDKDHFLLKPNLIYVPFGYNIEQLKIDLASPTKKRNIRFIQSRAREIDTIHKTIQTETEKISFDFLIVATGAAMHLEEIPGLESYGETIWTPDAMLSLKSSFESLARESESSKPKRILFLVPPNNEHPGPLYEIALMLDSWLRQHHRRDAVELVWSTQEDSYLSLFGPRLDEVIADEFERRQITGYKQYAVERVEAREVIYKNGESLPYDLLVFCPPYVAAMPFLGLPANIRGFVTTYAESRRVIECGEIYAIGDASNFPVKQAYLAVLQADVAADHIIADITNTEPEIKFKPVDFYVLDEFDTATFAQIPMQSTNFYDQSVSIPTDDPILYKVGSSPVWRLSKKLFSVYLTWRFNAGKPLHAGLTWQGMEAGLKVMSNVLAK